MVNIGESVVRALQGITIQAAKVSEMENVKGSIERGKFADLVAVKGNVQKDVNSIRTVSWVMKGGKVKKNHDIPTI